MSIKNLYLAETRKMSETKIREELKERTVYLRDNTSMTNEEIADFMSSTMNLAAALQEKWDNKNDK